MALAGRQLSGKFNIRLGIFDPALTLDNPDA